MTEEELDGVEVEVVTNQLQVILKETDLAEDKSKILFAKFATFFSDAEIWAKKAKAIKVTHESQKAVMDQARQGRLFLRKIRLDIENCRKELKEQSLREGRAIDKVAKVLKEQIEPVEEYLDKQEHFVEYREAEKEALVQVEVMKRMEEERLAEEKRKAEELEVTRKALHEAEEKLRLQKQKELKEEADTIRKAEALKAGSDSDKMVVLLAVINAIILPQVTSAQAKKAIGDVEGHLNMCRSKIKPLIKEEEEY